MIQETIEALNNSFTAYVESQKMSKKISNSLGLFLGHNVYRLVGPTLPLSMVLVIFIDHPHIYTCVR